MKEKFMRFFTGDNKIKNGAILAGSLLGLAFTIGLGIYTKKTLVDHGLESVVCLDEDN